MQSRKFLIACALAASSLTAAHAQSPGTSAQSMPSASASHLAVGVVKAIDAKTRSLTISHQAIATMGMPAMTMSFRADPSVNIDPLKPGESIAFVLTPGAAGALSITALQAISGSGAASHGSMAMMPGMPHASGKAMTMEECHNMMMQRK
jgi:Cu(I)/Ag(I) efflux system periplasmic protein CusF